MNCIKNSGECCKSELDLFYSIPTNTSILSSSYLTVSSNPLKGSEENFEINITGSEEYVDLSDIYLKLEVEIKNEKKFDEQDFKTGPINNFGHSETVKTITYPKSSNRGFLNRRKNFIEGTHYNITWNTYSK